MNQKQMRSTRSNVLKQIINHSNGVNTLHSLAPVIPCLPAFGANSAPTTA